MSPTDVESQLRAALQAQARAQVPDTERPPAARWLDDARPAPTRRRWVAPLAVAASIALLASGGFVWAQSRSARPVTPAVGTPTVTSTPGPTGVTPTPTGDTGTPTTTPSITVPQTTAPLPTGSGTRTEMLGASLVVPTGWTARSYTGDGQSTPITDTWCLDRPGTRDCAVQLMRPHQANEVDADTASGLAVNPALCGAQVVPLADYTELSFGGRPAEYRYWHATCDQDGAVVDVAQYTVVTPTAYTLFSEHADAAVRDAMRQLVTTATLPAATSTTRLYDRGIVKSAQTLGDGSVEVVIDRTVVSRPNSGSATYGYRVPAALVAGPGGESGTRVTDTVGRTVRLYTDGSVVTRWYVGPGA